MNWQALIEHYSPEQQRLIRNALSRLFSKKLDSKTLPPYESDVAGLPTQGQRNQSVYDNLLIQAAGVTRDQIAKARQQLNYDRSEQFVQTGLDIAYGEALLQQAYLQEKKIDSSAQPTDFLVAVFARYLISEYNFLDIANKAQHDLEPDPDDPIDPDELQDGWNTQLRIYIGERDSIVAAFPELAEKITEVMDEMWLETRQRDQELGLFDQEMLDVPSCLAAQMIDEPTTDRQIPTEVPTKILSFQKRRPK